MVNLGLMCVGSIMLGTHANTGRMCVGSILLGTHGEHRTHVCG